MNAEQDRRYCSSISPETLGWPLKIIVKKKEERKEKKERKRRGGKKKKETKAAKDEVIGTK